jgi:hypothetical protein
MNSDDHAATDLPSRSVAEADRETREMSSRILDIISIEGKVSEVGPGVSRCQDNGARDLEGSFMIRHPWNISTSAEADLRLAMERLREQLPQEGWKITEYGPNNSEARTLTLIADHHGKRFGVNVEFWNRQSAQEIPKLVVTVVSGCNAVPAGQSVSWY